MGSIVQVFIYILIAYTLMGVFQYRVSSFFSSFGMMTGSLLNVFSAFQNYFGITIPTYVFLLYGSLIFLVIYKVFRVLYLSGKK